MAMTKKTVLEVDTSPAVKSIGELRNNIKELKKQLNEQDLSSPEGMAKYGELLKELNANQNVLRDSMHATSSSWKELTEAATGANIAFKDNGELVSMEGVSYNALVHKLKDLTEVWRSTQDASERAKLGSQIKSVNDELKGMDESAAMSATISGPSTTLPQASPLWVREPPPSSTLSRASPPG